MSKSLEDAEKTCYQILRLIDGVTIHTLSSKKKEDMMTRVGSVRSLLSRSKKKIMMKTTKGKQLAQQAKIDLTNLERMVMVLSKKADVKLIEELSNKAFEQLDKVEADADNIVTYWQSYESVLT